MNKFTPGSWYFYPKGGQIKSGYNHQVIATLPAIETLSNEVFPTKEHGNVTEDVLNRQANGFLMAEAPEMLKALYRIRDEAFETHTPDGYPIDKNQALQWVVDIALEAIAKYERHPSG